MNFFPNQGGTMSHVRLLLPLLLFACFFGGCGGKSPGAKLQKGDILVIEEDLRERAETQWADAYTDGFITVLPKGTRVEVLFAPAPAAQIFECRPVEINGKTDPTAVEEEIVPEHIRTKDGYVSYVFALKKAYLGTKVKKVK